MTLPAAKSSRHVLANPRERLVPLDEALALHIAPRSSLFLATDSHAAVRSLVRVFWGTSPALTVICLRAGAADTGELLFAGLVRKLVAASFGTQFPSFRPSPPIQRAYSAGAVEFECWSLFTLVQRLMAGALGVPFFPTQSLVDSSLANDNRDFAFVSDPFSGSSTPVVSALQPDVAIVNALAADSQGNAIINPPFEDDLWSTRAAKKGVIVLAENIVSTDFIRLHAHLVKIPAQRVLAVCHVPFAAHPDGFESTLGLQLQVEGYTADTEHRAAYDAATRHESTFRQWVEQWTLGVKSHDEYISRLARKPRLWKREQRRAGYDMTAPSAASQVERSSLTARDRMAIAAARIAMDVMRRRKLYSLLVGVGQAELAGALAYYLLREAGFPIQLVEGVGRIGFEPAPIPNARQSTATMLTGTVDTYGTIVGGNRRNCLALLGAGQIDEMGNMNSTLVNGKFLVGSGGANDAVSLAAETIALVTLAPGRTVRKVEYVTCPGAKVGHLVTDHGVFRKDGHGRFQLWRYFRSARVRSAEDAVAEARQRCGWEVTAAIDIDALDEPLNEELTVMHWLTRSGDAAPARSRLPSDTEAR